VNKRQLVYILGLIGVMVLLGAGCGGDEDSSSDNGSDGSYPAEFNEMVDNAMAPVSEWPGPTSSPKLKPNQLVFSIPCSKVAEGCEFINQGVKDAAEAVGWDYKTVDPEGSPEKSNAAIRQAVQANADVIVMVAIDPKVVSDALGDAQDAGIPVVLVAGGREGEPELLANNGVFTDVTFRSYELGELLGAFIAVNSDGEAKVAMFNTPEWPTIDQRFEGTKASLSECPGCEVVAETDFAQTEIGTTLGSKYQSVLQANPDADYAWVGLDAAASVLVAANQQAGSDQAQITSIDGNKQNIDYVMDGSQLVTIGSPLNWTGWAALDEANRAVNGAEPATDNIPYRLITKENAEQFVGTGFEGDIDYQAKYLQLWKTGKTSKSVDK